MPSLLQKFFPKRRSSLTGNTGAVSASKDDSEITVSRARQARRRSLLETGGGGSGGGGSSSLKNIRGQRQEKGDNVQNKNSHNDVDDDEEEDELAQIRSLIVEQHQTKQVVIWVKSFCMYCEMARDLFQRQLYNGRGGTLLDIAVHDLSRAPKGNLVMLELQKMTQHRTVPLIFVNGKFIGGNSELLELFHSDKLEPMLFPDFENTIVPSKSNLLGDNTEVAATDAEDSKDDSKPKRQIYYRAVWKGTVLAKAAEPVIVRGLSYYFPPDSVRQEYLRVSKEHTTTCGWKGEASYWHIKVKGKGVYRNAAWAYKDPLEEARHFKDFVSFDQDVVILKGLELMRTSL